MNGPMPSMILVKTVSSFEGEPIVQFSVEEVKAMAIPFKLTLVVRILAEHDVTQLPLSRIRIGVGDSGFWQSVVYVKIPHFCTSYKHLGHGVETCYLANPGLRPQQPKGAR